MDTAPVEVKRSTQAVSAPADPWRSFRTEMDRLFDRFTGSFGMPSFGRLFDAAPVSGMSAPLTVPNPAIDLTEDNDGYHLTAELPGMTEKDIELVLSGDRLTVKGEKKQETEQKEKDYHLSERSYGMFQRSFYLPENVDREKIEAAFNKGVLTVKLPKTAEAKPTTQKIDIKPAA